MAVGFQMHNSPMYNIMYVDLIHVFPYVQSIYRPVCHIKGDTTDLLLNYIRCKLAYTLSTFNSLYVILYGELYVTFYMQTKS